MSTCEKIIVTELSNGSIFLSFVNGYFVLDHLFYLLKNILKGSSRGIIQLSIPKEGRKSMVDLLWIFPSVDIDIEEKFKYL